MLSSYANSAASSSIATPIKILIHLIIFYCLTGARKTGRQFGNHRVAGCEIRTVAHARVNTTNRLLAMLGCGLHAVTQSNPGSNRLSRWLGTKTT